MEVSAHSVTNGRTKVTLHDNYAVKEISFVEGKGNEMNIKQLGKARNDLRFIISDTIEARENERC